MTAAAAVVVIGVLERPDKGRLERFLSPIADVRRGEAASGFAVLNVMLACGRRAVVFQLKRPLHARAHETGAAEL